MTLVAASVMPLPKAAHPGRFERLTPLLRELNDLKRVRAAHFKGSYADRLFVAAWRLLVNGAPVRSVALQITARALAATRLAGIDADTLAGHGLQPHEIEQTLRFAIDDLGDAVPDALRDDLRNALTLPVCGDVTPLPAFVGQLVRQPRAGATHPGKPRMILEPAESHGDHCLTVAVYAVLVTPRFGGDIGTVFLTGLAHHLFNGSLPDAGFNGDVVLERAGVKACVVERAFALAYAQLDPVLARTVRNALAFTKQTEPANSRCFHAADVFDRVLEMAWFDRVAQFRLKNAVRDLDIVHVAPEQSFQRETLTEAGIWREWPDAR